MGKKAKGPGGNQKIKEDRKQNQRVGEQPAKSPCKGEKRDRELGKNVLNAIRQMRRLKFQGIREKQSQGRNVTHENKTVWGGVTDNQIHAVEYKSDQLTSERATKTQRKKKCEDWKRG